MKLAKLTFAFILLQCVMPCLGKCDFVASPYADWLVSCTASELLIL